MIQIFKKYKSRKFVKFNGEFERKGKIINKNCLVDDEKDD